MTKSSKQQQSKKVSSKAPRKQTNWRESSRPMPVSKSRVVSRGQPSIHSTSDGTLRVTHSEYTTSFSFLAPADGQDFYIFPGTTSYGPLDVNPGFSGFLPWGSTIARNYERYRFHKLNFRFVPKQPTTAAGFALAAFDYDFLDEPASSKAEMLTNQTCVEATTFTEFTVRCDPKALIEGAMAGGWRYISNATASSNLENRETMAGYLIFAVDALAALATYGWDVFVEYDLELKVARPPSETGAAVTFSPGVIGEFVLDSSQPTVGAAGYPLSLAGDSLGLINITSESPAVNSALSNASTPRAVDEGNTQPYTLFRFLKRVLGVVDIELYWASKESNGGTGGPSAKSTTNCWELRAYDLRDISATLADYCARAWAASIYGTDEPANQKAAFAKILPATDANPGTNEKTRGMAVRFCMTDDVWRELEALGLDFQNVGWGLANVGAATLAASVAITQLRAVFRPSNRLYHRAFLAPQQGRAIVLTPHEQDELVERDCKRVPASHSSPTSSLSGPCQRTSASMRPRRGLLY